MKGQAKPSVFLGSFMTSGRKRPPSGERVIKKEVAEAVSPAPLALTDRLNAVIAPKLENPYGGVRFFKTKQCFEIKLGIYNYEKFDGGHAFTNHTYRKQNFTADPESIFRNLKTFGLRPPKMLFNFRFMHFSWYP